MTKKEELKEIVDPRVLASRLMLEKNLWLTRVRWWYTVFIGLFFFTYNFFSDTPLIGYRALVLLLGLSFWGNIIFLLTIRRNRKISNQDLDYPSFLALASLQLDFDLVLLSLMVFFSGGFESLLMVLFILYIVLSNFMTTHRKAFRNTLTAVVLVVVIFFSDKELVISSRRLIELLAFITILFFAYFISAYLSHHLRENEESLHDLLGETKQLSVTDRLTHLYDNSHFLMLLNLQLEKSRRYETPFSIVMFDVDHFKSYNDANGHLKGSEALQTIAELMKKIFRASDILSRYGGDEFAVILPISDKVGAYLAADRMREAVEAEPFEGTAKQPGKKLTLSMGIASYPEHGASADQILDNADKALYRAKKMGRNRAVIYEPTPEEGVGG